MALVVVGCLVPVDLGGGGFRCQADADCGEAEQCVYGTCRVPRADGCPLVCGTTAREAVCVLDPRCPTDAAVCDGFSSPELAGWQPLGVEADAGTSAIRQVERHLCKANIVELQLSGGTQAALRRRVAPRPSLHVRTMVFVPEGLALTDNLRLLTVSLDNAVNSAGMNDDAHGPVYVDPSGEGLTNGPSLPTGRWTCLELAVTEGDSAEEGRIELWVDGVSVAAMSAATRTGPAPAQVAEVIVGPQVSSPQGEVLTLWFDDVAVGYQRIGCE